MKSKFLGVFAALAAIMCATPAVSATIIFRATGTATGFSTTAGAFSNMPFTVTATADTNSKRQCTQGNVLIPNCFLLINDSLSVDVAGLGSFDILSPSLSIRNALGAFSFAEVYSSSPLGIRTLMAVNISGSVSPLTNYDLISDVPLFSTGAFVQRTDAVPGPGQLPIPVTGGALLITQTTISQGSFEAFLRSSVPEPAAWAMMVAGFGFVGGAMRRRQSVRVTYA